MGQGNSRALCLVPGAARRQRERQEREDMLERALQASEERREKLRRERGEDGESVLDAVHIPRGAMREDKVVPDFSRALSQAGFGSATPDFGNSFQVPTQPTTSVRVAASTWARNAHNLFDFEASHQHQTFTVLQSGVCARHGENVELLSERAVPRPGAEPLLRISQRAEGVFSIGRDLASWTRNERASSKHLWEVVRESATPRYDLSVDDVVKLGRYRFRVCQLVTEEGVMPNLQDAHRGRPSPCARSDGDGDAPTACRICLEEGSSEEDPLVSPCRCAGSVRHVHLGCLRHWIAERLGLPADPTNSYCYRPPTCELCTASYPEVVSGGGKSFPLVELPPVAPPFLVLESLVKESGARGPGSALHVVSLAGGGPVRLGRGHEADVRVSDVSMSRVHATVRFDGGGFVLEDNGSKFGTLVMLRKPRTLAEGSRITLMSGRTMLALSAEPRESPRPAPEEAASCDGEPAPPAKRQRSN